MRGFGNDLQLQSTYIAGGESMNTFNNIQEIISVGQISANSIVNADCLEAMSYIADKSIDCILTDLPYG